MPAYICVTCGIQHAESEALPSHCIICEDERQYVGWGGQQWTTLDEMRAKPHESIFREHERGLTGIVTSPRFAIGQRALLVQTPAGNALWDGLSYIDDATVERIRALGGIAAISASHPHFYGSIVEYAHAFGARIFLPRADEQWITRPDDAIELYDDSVEVLPGITVVRTGGHFEGSAVMRWAAGAQKRGVLLTGDTIAVAQDRRYVTFMRSYPNYIPLDAPAVRGVVDALRPYEFDRLYGGWWALEVSSDAKRAVERSAERYIASIGAG